MARTAAILPIFLVLFLSPVTTDAEEKRFTIVEDLLVDGDIRLPAIPMGDHRELLLLGINFENGTSTLAQFVFLAERGTFGDLTAPPQRSASAPLRRMASRARRIQAHPSGS